MNQARIGKFISKLRHEKGITQEEFGNRIGVSSKTISRWENGNYMPDISLLEPISNELDITISELLKGQKIEKENLITESNKDILNLLKSNKNDRKKYTKFFIIGGIVLLIGIIISIVQTIRLNNAIEDDGILLKNGIYTSEMGAEIDYNELLILQQIHRLEKEKIEQITQEEVDLLVESYYAQIEAIHWYGSLYAIADSLDTKVNVFDTDVRVVKVIQKYLPFTTIVIEDNPEEYYCLLGYSKFGTFIFSKYEEGECVITEKECSILKEDGIKTNLNLNYCN